MAIDPVSNAEGVLLALTVGGVMGLFGQGIRAVAGLKTMVDAANKQNPDSQDQFRAARLIVSLIIGFLSGIAATLITGVDKILPHLGDIQTLLMLAAAGYAGTDFIESFLSNYLPGGKPNVPNSNDPVNTVDGGTTPASTQALADLTGTLNTLRSNVSLIMTTLPVDKATVARQAVYTVLKGDGKLFPGIDDMTFSGADLGYAPPDFLSFLLKVAKRISDANHRFNPNMAFAIQYVDSTVATVIEAIGKTIDSTLV